jgi:hypothetical protein
MENKQYPPRGGPPLVYRCRGSGWRAGTRVFLTAHSNGWRDFRIAHSILEGLHGYSSMVTRENSTPFGVVPNTYAWCYKYLIPPESSEETFVRTRDGTKTRARDGTVFRTRDGTRVFHHRYPLQGPTAHLTGWRDFCHRHPFSGRIAHSIPERLHGYSLHIREETKTRARDETVFSVGTPGNIRDGTEIHIRCGTGLGSRKALENQPVHPPEWERYAREEDGSWKTEVGRWNLKPVGAKRKSRYLGGTWNSKGNVE